MKAEELRIGNWVNTVKGHRQCIDVLCGSINFQDIQNEIYDDIEPIPLTEEWLLKMGFKETDDFLWFGNFSYNKETHQFHWYGVIMHDMLLKSVHQLQNLYFALTGEELTLK